MHVTMVKRKSINSNVVAFSELEKRKRSSPAFIEPIILNITVKTTNQMKTLCTRVSLST